MTKAEQARIDAAYANAKMAMDDLLQVCNKDKGLIQAQGLLYKAEDILYQYVSNPKRRAQ